MNNQKILETINYFSNKININFRKFPSRDYRRLINYTINHNISTTLDVGANVGQFAEFLFRCGYTGNIISFEPQKTAFEKLHKRQQNSINKKRWIVVNKAMGSSEGKTIINNSKNSVSSSILPVLSQHTKVASESKFIASEEIEITTVDNYLANNNINPEIIFLKIDTQGYESEVLKGAINSLKKIKAVQLEMAILPLYDGEVLFDDLKKNIENFGFCLSSIESGIADEETGKLLQVDAIFVK